MEKVLINLSVPSAHLKCDMYISPLLKVKDATVLMEKSTASLSDYRYVPAGNKFLCWEERNILLDENSDFLSYGIGNGDHLLLI